MFRKADPYTPKAGVTGSLNGAERRSDRREEPSCRARHSFQMLTRHSPSGELPRCPSGAHAVPSYYAGQGCGGILPEDPDNAARVSRSTVRDRAVLRTRRHG